MKRNGRVNRNARQVLRRALNKSTAKQVAADLGVSLSTIYKWSEEGESGRCNPLERSVALCRSTGDAGLLQWLCAELDGFFVANPKVKRMGDVESLLAWCRAMRRLMDLQSALTEPLKGAAMSPAAVERLRELWEALKSEMEWYVKLSERCALAAFLPQRTRVFARA